MVKKSVCGLFLLLASGWVLAAPPDWPTYTGQWNCHGPLGLTRNAQVVYVDAAIVGIWAGIQGGGMYLRPPYGPWVERNGGLSSTEITGIGAFKDWKSLWAGTTEGLYRSINWTTWTKMDGVGSEGVTALTTYEGYGAIPIEIVYFGNRNGKLYSSRDHGVSWVDMTADLPPWPITAIKASEDGIWVGNDHGMVFKSVQGGGWTEILPGDNQSSVRCLTLDYTVNPFRLLVGCERTQSGGRRGAFWTNDNGVTWHLLGLNNRNVLSLLVDRLHPGTLYAGCSPESDYSVLYRSTNGGLSWLPRDSGLEHAIGVCSLAMYTGASVEYWPQGTLFAGLVNGAVCQSANDGASWEWTVQRLSFSNITGLAAQAQNPHALYAGDDAGNVYRSADQGRSWSATSADLAKMPFAGGIEALSVDPAAEGDSPAILAGSFGHVRRSPDGGKTWTSFPVESNLHSLAYDPLNNAQAYAGGGAYSPTSGFSFYRSTDGGQNWTPTITGNTIACLAASAQSADLVYVGFGSLYPDGPRVRRSNNAGVSWLPVGLTDNVACLAIHPKNDQFLYAGMEDATVAGVYRSQDGGQVWTPFGVGLTCLRVYCLTVNPLHPNVIYAGTDNGVFRSHDGGATWDFSNAGLWNFTINDIVLQPNSPSRVYAATQEGVFYRVYQLDVNLDGWFDSVDLDFSRLVLAEAHLDQPFDLSAADLDEDGKLDAVDLVRMMMALTPSK